MKMKSYYYVFFLPLILCGIGYCYGILDREMSYRASNDVKTSGVVSLNQSKEPSNEIDYTYDPYLLCRVPATYPVFPDTEDYFGLKRLTNAINDIKFIKDNFVQWSSKYKMVFPDATYSGDKSQVSLKLQDYAINSFDTSGLVEIELVLPEQNAHKEYARNFIVVLTIGTYVPNISNIINADGKKIVIFSNSSAIPALTSNAINSISFIEISTNTFLVNVTAMFEVKTP